MMLGWRPFLDPIDAHAWWFALMVPLALGISVAYRAIRLERVGDGRYWWSVVVMTVQVVAAMILLGAASYVFIQVIVPRLVPMPE